MKSIAPVRGFKLSGLGLRLPFGVQGCGSIDTNSTTTSKNTSNTNNTKNDGSTDSYKVGRCRGGGGGLHEHWHEILYSIEKKSWRLGKA